jgi:hypothetical protein
MKIEFREVVSKWAENGIRTREAECPNGHSGGCVRILCPNTARYKTEK